MSRSTPSLPIGPRSAWLAIIGLCAAANLLAMTSAIYTLQIYDRVLASQSVPTLLALSALAGGLYLSLGAIEAVRGQIMVRIADRVDSDLMREAHGASLRLPLIAPSADPQQPIRDADTVRGFLAGPGPAALLDLPWAPLYLAVVYLLSPPLAAVAAVGLLLLCLISLTTERVATRAEDRALRALAARSEIAESAQRNAAAARAMGLQGALTDRFLKEHDDLVRSQTRAGDGIGTLSAISRTLRLALQSAIVGFGAYLAIGGDITAGAIIAASILAGRALAPVEQAIAHWRGFVAYRRARGRLAATIAHCRAPAEALTLQHPKSTLDIEGLTVAVPGTHRIVLRDVTLSVPAGTIIAVAGQSAAGKSTLARALVGVWPAVRGSVRLDGASLDQWASDEIGRHIGYVPQEVELFAGTIAENIARLSLAPDAGAVVAAAKAAGVHEMILKLPEGYETRVGPQGCLLSGGQRQRIALARALYGSPFLVILDEPNANLDAEGERALIAALKGVKARGGIAILIAHRNSVIAAADRAVVLENGRLVEARPLPARAEPANAARGHTRLLRAVPTA